MIKVELRTLHIVLFGLSAVVFGVLFYVFGHAAGSRTRDAVVEIADGEGVAEPALPSESSDAALGAGGAGEEVAGVAAEGGRGDEVRPEEVRAEEAGVQEDEAEKLAAASPSMIWELQVAQYLLVDKAQELADEMATLGYPSKVVIVRAETGASLLSVRIGEFQSRKEAVAAARRFVELEGRDASVVSRRKPYSGQTPPAEEPAGAA